MGSLIYKVLKHHFYNECGTFPHLFLNTSNSRLFFSTLSVKCEFICSAPPQEKSLSSRYIYIVVDNFQRDMSHTHHHVGRTFDTSDLVIQSNQWLMIPLLGKTSITRTMMNNIYAERMREL